MFSEVGQRRVDHRNRSRGSFGTNPDLLQAVKVSENPFELEDLNVPGSSHAGFGIPGSGASLHQRASKTGRRHFVSGSVGKIEISTQFPGAIPSKPTAECGAGRVVRVRLPAFPRESRTGDQIMKIRLSTSGQELPKLTRSRVEWSEGTESLRPLSRLETPGKTLEQPVGLLAVRRCDVAVMKQHVSRFVNHHRRVRLGHECVEHFMFRPTTLRPKIESISGPTYGRMFGRVVVDEMRSRGREITAKPGPIDLILTPRKPDEIFSSGKGDHQMSNRPLGAELGWVSKRQPEIIHRVSSPLEELTVPSRLGPRQIGENLEPPGPMPLQCGEAGLNL